MTPVHVSITGLRVRGLRHQPSFWVHAVRSLRQARAAPGNISAEARTIAGVHHTLSVWTDEAAMRAYLRAGAHLQAMRRFPAIATGKVVGFAAERAPDWADVPGLWRDRGRVV
jgi:quinol monooxygenase YgiN